MNNANQQPNEVHEMKVYPTMQSIELTESNGMIDVVIDGKLIDTFDKVELVKCNGSDYANCYNYSHKYDTYLSVDTFKIKL